MTDYFFTVLCFLTALALIRLMFMVYKKLGNKDLVISFMLFFLTLACLAQCLFFGESIFYATRKDNLAEDTRRDLKWRGGNSL